MSASPARLLLLPVLAGSLVLSGCGTYRDATAYFNTYYNASRLFDQAVAEVLKIPQPAKDSNYFAPFKTTPQAVTKFEKVIEKGSRLIQFHGESGYVEDAIMMIGKAYLYQNETESAAGKFRELLDNFPESDKRAEARLWLAKALYQGRNDQEALIAAKELSAPVAEGEEEIPGDVLLEISMLEAQIYADRGEYAQAAEALVRSGSIDGDSRLKAIAQFQLGSVYEQTKEYGRAAEAYRLVGELGPSPAMAFNSRLREGVMLSASGDPDRALEAFDELIAWPLKPEQAGLVDLEIANAYWDKGDSAAAFTLYDIIDSSYKRTDAAARSYYRRGMILGDQYLDLVGARKYFSSAKGEFPASAITQDAAARFVSLDNYLKASERLWRDDSTLHALLHPGAPDSVDSTGAAGELPDSLAAGDSAANGTIAGKEEDAGDADGAEGDAARESVPERRPPPQIVAAENLSMRAIRMRPRHLVPDPEDPGFIPPSEEEAGAGEGGVAGRESLEARDASKPAGKGGATAAPKAPLTPEELSKRIAAGKFELGGIFLLDLGLPDSALHYYRLVVDDHPGSPLIPKTLYAMSEAYKVTGDSASVDSLHDLILAEHAETDYADQVRVIRGLDTLAAAVSDEASRYERAEDTLFAGDAQAALAEFRDLSAVSTDSLVTQKACYAVGWIYDNVIVDLDSAAAWYKKLISAYPSSAYAKAAAPRVAVRDDTSKLQQFVKFKAIEAVPKPRKQALGLVPRQGEAGRGSTPPLPGGEIGRPPGTPPAEDEYYNPEEDEDPEEADPDEEEEEEEDSEEDPGLSAWNGTPGEGMANIPV